MSALEVPGKKEAKSKLAPVVSGRKDDKSKPVESNPAPESI